MKKVGHFWNICGIGGLLARYLDKYYPGQYESVAIDRGHADVYSQNNEKSLVWHNRAAVWLARCFFYARKLDIIHVHVGIQWLPYYRKLYPRKKLVIHVHGSKIRGRWHLEPNVNLADGILVSTPDLLEGSPAGSFYLPNPIDQQLIAKIRKSVKERIPDAFHVDRYAVDVALKYARQNDIKLKVFNRDETPLPHAAFLTEMAKHEFFINVERSRFLQELARHEFYVDVKRDYPGYAYEEKVLEAFSLTGLEALALGCKVIDWKGEIHKGLPVEHRGDLISRRLNYFYQRMEETPIE